jgi:hypothetical protein
MIMAPHGLSRRFVRVASEIDQRGLWNSCFSESSQPSDPCFGKLGVRINPGFSKIYYEPFRFRSGFEPIRQRVNCVRVPLAIYLPSDFCARTPEFGALLQRRIRDDESILVKQVCHDYLFKSRSRGL